MAALLLRRRHAAPGDTNGQSLDDIWWVIDAAGNAVKGEVAMGPTVRISDSGLGAILTDADGNTLYLFEPDEQGPSVCNGGCAAAWPPLIGEMAAGDGVDGSLLGTAEREDGSIQATYNGWPLYYFAGDTGPGDTNGQSLDDIWWVIDAAGNAIRTT